MVRQNGNEVFEEAEEDGDCDAGPGKRDFRVNNLIIGPLREGRLNRSLFC